MLRTVGPSSEFTYIGAVGFCMGLMPWPLLKSVSGLPEILTIAHITDISDSGFVCRAVTAVVSRL